MADKFSAILLSPVSNECFWGYDLQSVDGKEAPVKPVTGIDKQTARSAGVDDLDFVFEPVGGDGDLSSPIELSAEDIISLPLTSPSTSTITSSLLPRRISTPTSCSLISPSPPSCPFSAYIPSSPSPPSSPFTSIVPFSTSPPSIPLTSFIPISTSPPSSLFTNPLSTVDVGVWRLHLASLQLKNGLEQVINCGVTSEEIELITTTKCGNCSKVMLGEREISAIVLSLAGDQMVFLYLTVPGCLAVQNSLSEIPDISVPSMALGESRRVVIFVKNFEKEKSMILENALQRIVGKRLAIVNQTVGKNLLAKTVEHRTLFSAPGKIATARCANREERQSEDEGDEVSLVDRGDIGDSSASNYWADPVLLIASTAGQAIIDQFEEDISTSSPTVKRKADDNNNDSQVKKPLVTIIKHLAKHPTDPNGVEKQSLDPTISLSDLSMANQDLRKDALNASSKTSKSRCLCDDCVYVTKSDTKRTRALGPMNNCKCHPCVLSEHWELVTIRAYEGDNYWMEPWIEEMFKDIKNKRLMVKQAANLTGASYGHVYKQYGEWVTRLG